MSALAVGTRETGRSDRRHPQAGIAQRGSLDQPLAAEDRACSALAQFLYQANVKWTAGGLLLMSVACFVIPAYLVYLRTGAVPFALLIGLLLGAAPFVYVLHKRRKRFNKFEEELPEALNLMVSALRAGHSLVAALGLVGVNRPSPSAVSSKSAATNRTTAWN